MDSDSPDELFGRPAPEDVREPQVMRETMRLLRPSQRRRFIVLAGAQMSAAVLDMLALFLFGAVGVLAVAAAQGTAPPETAQRLLSMVGLGEVDLPIACLLLALAASALLIVRSVLSMFLLGRMTRFLVKVASDLSRRMIDALLSQSLLAVTDRPSHVVVQAVTAGVTYSIQVVLMSGAVLIAEFALLAALGLTLAVVDPWITIGAIIYFAGVSMILLRWVGRWTGKHGDHLASVDMSSRIAVSDAIATFREMTAAGRLHHHREKIGALRDECSESFGSALVGEHVPKFLMEAALLLAAALLTGLLLLTRDATTAVGALAMFLVAGTRVMPSIMRINSSRVKMRVNYGSTVFTLQLADSLGLLAPRRGRRGRVAASAGRDKGGPRDVPADEAQGGDDPDRAGGAQGLAAPTNHTSSQGVDSSPPTIAGRTDSVEPGVSVLDVTDTPAPPSRAIAPGDGSVAAAARGLLPAIEPGSGPHGPALDVALDSVTFRYPGASRPAVVDISLRAAPGRALAIVGPSGGGKSTLADLILGVLRPDSGRVLIGGEPPAAAIAHQPGAIAYVPQDVALVGGTVRENVALGLDPGTYTDDDVMAALHMAHLDVALKAARQGLDTVVGERGLRLSGGQRQRLGLARAVFTRPRLIVLDEATSALDSETEHAVTAALRDLSGSVTTITIAHRLATIRHSDSVAYLEDGQLLALGTFAEVRERIPRFDNQAHLLGL